MNFELSDDHQMLADTLARFFADTLPMDRRNAIAYAAPYHAPEIWRNLAELGVLGAFFSEDIGGFGGTAQDVAVVFETVGRALCPEPLLGHLMAGRLLSELGRTEMVEQMIAGEAKLALAVVEPGVTTDLSLITSEAVEKGGAWLLTGTKTAIYGGPSADHLLIAARVGHGLGLFRAPTPAMTVAGMTDGGGIAEMVMKDLEAECLSSDAGAAIASALDLGRIALCSEAVGAMSWLIEATTAYLAERKQFGRSLATFQALQHRLVDLVGELEQARSITISAVSAYGTTDQTKRAAMAKNLVGRAAVKVAEECIQMHGGIGMTWEYAGSHYVKRLIMLDAQLGDRFDMVGAMGG